MAVKRTARLMKLKSYALLWHERLRSLNVEIRWGGFAVAGVVAVVLTVPLAVVALWLTTGMH